MPAEVVDRGARDPGGISSGLTSRLLARGGKEAVSMLRVAGSKSGHDELDGRSLLDEIAREGARRMLVAALETEVAAYVEAHDLARDEEGHALVVRNGRAAPARSRSGQERSP
jgi:hypothetical protein